MRKMKKIASLMMALVMVMAMSVTAFASDYVITIQNSVTDKAYSAYKVFDATHDGEAVAYTITTSNAWYNLVSGTTTVTNSNDETVESPFTLTATTTSRTYNVSLKEGKSETDVAAWFNAITADQLTAAGITDTKTETGNGGTLTLDVGSAGYYYITSGAGALVTVTTAKPTASVVDKNQTPGSELDKTADDTEAQIGDSVTYTITSNIPTYDGETKIYNYVFVDTLSEGLTAPEAAAVTVKILDSTGAVYAYLTSSGTVNVYTVTNGVATVTSTTKAVVVNNTDNTITVTVAPTDITKATESDLLTGDTLSSLTSYPADATIKIIYTATVNTAAAFANGNSVKQTWTDDSIGATDTETVYTYGFNLQKVDSKNTATQLTGAKFKLYTTQTEGTAIKFSYNETSKTYTVDPNGSVTEIEVGYATIFGLDADVTYYLEETVAPSGYNLLGSRVAVTIDSTKTSESEGVITITQTEQVQNSSGTALPSTGGIGTTIFYIVGTVLVLGAAVVLITRRRMSSEA